MYIGSFWDKPLDESHDCFNLFQNEAADLIEDLNVSSGFPFRQHRIYD